MNTELTRLCEKLGGIRITNKYTGEKPPWHEDPAPWNGTGWKCTLRFQGRQLTTSFFQGSALTREPTAADVLYCLCAEASGAAGSFEDWCNDCDYSTDSRKALAAYAVCRALATRLRRFLGEAYNDFCRAEH